MLKKLWVFILLVLPVQYCFANEVIELEKIVVTPYKTAVVETLNPSSVDVISVEEANSQGIFTLTEAIKDIPSLSYATTGSLGGETGVFIRGANSAHTQVMLDGIKLYDPIVTSAYFFGYNYMSLDNLDKIEVLKGPYSSLYGSDSIGGTISLLTHKGQGDPTASYTQEFGSYKTFREMFTAQGELDKLAYSLSVSRSDVDAFYSGKYKDGNYEKDPFHNTNSSLRLDYALTDDIEVGLLANYTYAKYEYDISGGTDDNDNYGYFHQGVGGINLKHQLSDYFSYKAIFGYTRTYRKTWEDANTYGWYDGRTYQAKWQGDYQLCNFDKIIFGFDYLRELGESRSDYIDWWTSLPTISLSPKERSNTKGLIFPRKSGHFEELVVG